MSQHSKWFYSSLYLSIYITPDPSKDERLKRRGLQDMLKEKIEKFPDQHWVIRQGRVASKGKHSPKNYEELAFDKSKPSRGVSIISIYNGNKRFYQLEILPAGGFVF